VSRDDAGFEQRMAAARKARDGNGADPEPSISNAETITSKEFEAVTFIVADILSEGLGVFGGKSKIGKSWAALQIGLGVALGTPVLGGLKTTQSDVLYLALEESERRLQSRLRKLLAGQPAPRNLRIATAWQSGAAGVEYLDNFLAANAATRLIIVDPWVRMRGAPLGRLPAYQQDYSDLAPLHALANKHRICLLVVTHTRKQDATDIMDQISGTTGVQGMADSLWVLTRDRGQLLGTLTVTGRDIENDGSFAVDFNKTTGLWRILGPAEQVRRESEQDKVFQFLLVQAEPVGARDISEALGLKFNTVRSILQRLQTRHAVERIGRTAWKVSGGGQA
jgi:hypothetical protein